MGVRAYDKLSERKRPDVVAIAYMNPHESGINYRHNPCDLVNDENFEITSKYLKTIHSPCSVVIRNGKIVSQRVGNPRLRRYKDQLEDMNLSGSKAMSEL